MSLDSGANEFLLMDQILPTLLESAAEPIVAAPSNIRVILKKT
jgi:hypothetical protein